MRIDQESETGNGRKATFLHQSSGQGIGSWQACLEIETINPKDLPFRAAKHVKSVKSSNDLSMVWCGSKERGCQLSCRSRRLTMVLNFEVRRQTPSCSSTQRRPYSLTPLICLDYFTNLTSN
ncbi:hypothetical protein TNCV_4939641 [Trichonephila clavipes]|nr:hypothetical protein TNCV_4939641 [Trichonephila clavipes]